MKKISEIIAVHLKKWGINHVFGIPGKAVTALILDLHNHDIEFVLAKHESGAGFEAAGYALMKNQLAVAIGTSGPGGTNLLTSAGQAKASHLPVLFITGHPSIKDSGRALGQDSTMFGTDVVKMFEPVTKFSARVERADTFKAYFEHAIEKAYSGVKGPVHLSIAADVLAESIEEFHMDLPEVIHPVASNLEQCKELINRSEKKVIFVGKGVHSSRAYREVKMLAEIFDIPVMTTPGGKGAFESKHHLSLGAFGLGGTQEASAYVESGLDLMIVIGTKLSDMSVAGLNPSLYPKKMIHFDYDQTFIGKTIQVETLPILGDIKTNLLALFDKLNYKEIIKKPFDVDKYKGIESYVESKSPIRAVEAAKVMSATFDEDTVIFGDDGSHTFYAIQNYDVKRPGTFYFDDVFGTMGHAIGYAIGAKLAKPDAKIVCLTGDGCTFMHGSEISTAVNYGANVIFVVFNNGKIDMVDNGMTLHLGKAIGTVYRTMLDAQKYAESMGALAFKCSTAQELEDAIRQAQAANTTVVIEVIVDPVELPPTAKRG
ncbi:thiamine pyrophosphate-binding protein [Paenibacillus sp. HWE-109]|uniref:thiamine pyrophosphate-binding protein n=1 Tax=Paenibacillus sp. HWE-109 TaxID=1306526 RepID=UPI001EDE91E1|nr:thiamine pyrophosphate-binding protein [Paenibacillus sp. HWE-109]UKS26731.1 thiamine pyrophosphate-binding protein [Paenibacillus sp. HWE-109]